MSSLGVWLLRPRYLLLYLRQARVLSEFMYLCFDCHLEESNAVRDHSRPGHVGYHQKIDSLQFLPYHCITRAGHIYFTRHPYNVAQLVHYL